MGDILLFLPGHIQLKVDSIHSLLRERIPEDALCLIGLTMMDLFEDETDLFVAGLAAGNQRVAVGINASNTTDYRVLPLSKLQIMHHHEPLLVVFPS